LLFEGSMPRFILFLLLMSISVQPSAAGDAAVSRLNPQLVPLYRQLMSGQNADLVGKPLLLELRLKHASERFLLFDDTQVVVDSNTSYYLIRWQYEPEDIAGLIGKTAITCRVSGRIAQVIAVANPPRMPYLVVRLQSVTL